MAAGKLKLNCLWCSKEISRYPCQIKERNFCSQHCMSLHRTKKINPTGYMRNYKTDHIPELNRKLNPTRMTFETRVKLRNSKLGTGAGKSYEKTFGRHTHRIVAEQMLGRPLNPGEVVHHINGNRRDNRPENLRVFASQAEHAAWHVAEEQFFKGTTLGRGGGADE